MPMCTTGGSHVSASKSGMYHRWLIEDGFNKDNNFIKLLIKVEKSFLLLKDRNFSADLFR